MLQVNKLSKKRFHAQQKKEFREFQQQTTGFRDQVNPDKRENFRAANAEEALIAYLFQNNDMAKRILSVLPPEKFSTAFNRRVYEMITGKIIDGASSCSLTDISDSFSMEEISAIARILAKYHAVSMSQEDAEEYVNVILDEKSKLNANDAKNAQTQEIQDYLARLREQKK